MRIGIIGAGNIGATLARLFVEAGHEVAIANSRGPETLIGLTEELGERATPATVHGAAAFGEVVVEAIPFGRVPDLPADALAGKILVSASNYYPERDGEIDLGDDAQSAWVARQLPGARVVKAFNTIWYRHLQTQGDATKPVEARRVIFVAGDDAEAKRTVAELVEAIGFGPLDAGTLSESARLEPGAPVYNEDLTVAEARERLG